MSVTFQIESIPTGAFQIECDDVVVGTADSYDGILVERAAHMLVCEDCQHYGCYSQPVMDVSAEHDVNLANTNARMILIALGLDTSEELCGSATGEDFLGRVLIALAEDRDDSGVASAVIGGKELGQSGATMIDCGLPEGYFASRFGALHALASEAVRLGRDIHWS